MTVPLALGIGSVAAGVALLSGGGGSGAVLIGAAVLIIVVGPVFCLVGLFLRAARRPTAAELAHQDPSDSRTWVFRPAGLMMFVALFVVLAGLGVLAEAGLGGRGGRVLGSMLVLPFVALLSVRKVRSLVFYVEDRPPTGKDSPGDKPAEPSAAADRGAG